MDNQMNVSTSPNSVKMGDTIDINANKIANDNNPVIFKVNNKTLTDKQNNIIQVTPKSNNANVKYTIPDGTKAGKVQVTAISNINNTQVESYSYFNIEKMNTHFANVSITRNKSVNIKSTIVDDNNHTMCGLAKVSIKVNGNFLKDSKNNIKHFKVNDGILNATFKLNQTMMKKNFTVILGLEDTDAYYGSNHQVRSGKDGSSMAVPIRSFFVNTTIERYKNAINITSLLRDINNNKVKDTMKVYVKINGITLKTNKKLKYFDAVDGFVNITFKINKNLMKKTVIFDVVACDSYSYKGKKESITSIYDGYTKTMISPVTKLDYTDVFIRVNVTNSRGRVIETGNVTVYINDNAYITETITELNQKISLDNITSGTYNIKVLYNGGYYKKSESNGVLIVERLYKDRTTPIASVFVRLYHYVGQKDLQQWIDGGITDVYVQAKELTNDTDNLRQVIKLCQGTNIKVHAWVLVFRVDNKWHYTNGQANKIKNFISQVIKIDGVEGVVLDYVRYSGATPKIVKPSFITNFVKDTYNIIKSYDKRLELSACVFPEFAATKTYYGQDYSALSPYLDYMMPMAYKSLFKKDRNWLVTVTNYVKARSPHAKVLVSLITYSNTKNVNSRYSLEDITADIKTILNAGSVGYSLFRHGVLLEYPKIY